MWHNLVKEHGNFDQESELDGLKELLSCKKTCIQRDLEEALVLTPNQVKAAPYRLKKKYGSSGYMHIFETKSAVQCLLRKNGGIPALLGR